MSRSWLWNSKDDQKVLAWVAKTSDTALLEGNYSFASEMLKGASNFFHTQGFVVVHSSNAALVDKWLYGICSEIYSGTSNIYSPEIETKATHHSVIECFRLLNAFFDSNNLHTQMEITLDGPMSDLIIPEPYEDDGISG